LLGANFLNYTFQEGPTTISIDRCGKDQEYVEITRKIECFLQTK